MAIIGLAHSHVWGHLRTVIADKPVKLVGIAESNPELIAEARKLGASSVEFYDAYGMMLGQTKPAFVWAFVENNRHLEIVEACAPRGIHVIFEKPLASTYKEARAIRDLAVKHNIKVMCNYQMAWWPASHTAKALADAGAVGKVWRVRGVVGHGGPRAEGARSKYFFDWLTDPVKNGAGALMDFGCYNALWALWHLGRPESVYAQVNQLRPETFPKVEDSSTLVLHYKNGVGLFEGSWNLPHSYQDLEIFGLQGSLSMRNGRVDLRRTRAEAEEVALEPLPPERSSPIAFMLSAIRDNRPIEGITGLDINVDVMEILEAAKQSVKSGRAIPLPLR